MHCPVPYHADENPSVSIGVGKSVDLVLKCFGGCPQDVVWDAVMEMVGSQRDKSLDTITPKQEERYWYHDDEGTKAFCVERYYDSTGNKRFRQFHMCAGVLVSGMGEGCSCNDVPRLLFNLDTLSNQGAIFWVEGEKDCETLREHGELATCTPQGSQSFAKCLSSNPDILKPLKGRDVYVIADNDVPGRKYARDVADALVEYANEIYILDFGESYPTGYDISDHLGLGYDFDDWVNDNARLVFDAKDPDGTWNSLPPYDENAVGDVTIYFKQPNGQAQIEVVAMRIDVNLRSVVADLRISKVAKNGIRTTMLPSTNLNLMANSPRNTLCNALKKRHPEYDWEDIINSVAAVVERKIASDVDVIDVNTSDISTTDDKWLCEPIISGGEHVVLYAQGGVGKSLLAGAGVLSVATGKPFIHGMVPHASGVPSLYLDWEDTEDAYVSRMRRMASGAGVEIPDDTCHYAKMVYPLVEQLDRIKREVDSKGIELVVIDSVGTAMGGDINSSHTALLYQRLVQSLGCAVISITHVSKGSKKESDSPDAIGSVYFMNGPRSAFFLAGDSTMDLGAKDHVLVHTKSNSGNIQKPMGYKIDYGEHTGDITFYPSSPFENVRLRQYCDLLDTLEYFLTFKAMTLDELTDELPEVKQSTIKKWLTYYNGKKFTYNIQDETWTTM